MNNLIFWKSTFLFSFLLIFGTNSIFGTNFFEFNNSDRIIRKNINELDSLACEIESVVFECQGLEANRAAAEAWHQGNIEKLKANCIARDSGMVIISTIIDLDIFNNPSCVSCKIHGYYEVIDTVGENTFDVKRATFEMVDTSPPVFLDSKYDTIECFYQDTIHGWSEGVQNYSRIDECNIFWSMSYPSTSLIQESEKSKTYKSNITITDFRVNEAFETIYLTVLDTTPPNISCNPVNQIYQFQELAVNQKLAVQWNEANISLLDNCSREYCSDVFVTSDFDINNLTNSCSNKDSLVVTYTISDEYNNIATKTATLFVTKDISTYSCACIDVQSIDNELIINNLTAPNTITKIFGPNWQITFNCSGDCPETVNIPDLIADETYHTDVQFYDENWNFICADKRDIEIIGGGELCDTSVCNGDVILRTQAEVDAFCGCEVISGNLVLLGEGVNNGILGKPSDIADIKIFNSLRNIKGDLVIWNTNLTSLSDFSNLSTIKSNPWLMTIR